MGLDQRYVAGMAAAPSDPLLLSNDPSSPFHEVADHVRLAGAEAEGPARLLVEVPHGADRYAHYRALAERMVGSLPDQLEHFFFVNTDVGAWQLGVAVARSLVAADPSLTVELVRCRIPRTFVDTNRVPGGGGEVDLRDGGMTPGLAPYIDHPDDRRLLSRLHGAYLDAVQGRLDAICGEGGYAFLPHTYGPVTMGIDRVDHHIVERLHWALAPERADTWPLRPEVDLIHADAEGTSYAPAGAIEALRRGYEALGIAIAENETYRMHPSTMGMVWSQRHPNQVLSLEVRRDRLVREWTPFAEMEVQEASVRHFGGPIAEALRELLHLG